MIIYINSYSPSTARPNLPLPAWGAPLRFPGKLLSPETYARQTTRHSVAAQARALHVWVAGLPVRQDGSWYRAGANKVRIRGNQDNHILGIEGVRHALRAHGERRSLEEDPESHRHHGQTPRKPGDPRHPLAHHRRGCGEDRQRLSLLRGGLLDARLPPRRTHRGYRGEPRQPHKRGHPLSQGVCGLRVARLALPLDEGALPQALLDRVG